RSRQPPLAPRGEAPLRQRGHSRKFLYGGVDPRLRELDVLELAREVRVVRGHVEVAVSREPEEDDLLLARLAGLQRLLDRRLDRVRRLWRWEEALRAREAHRLREALVLLVRARLDDLVVDEHAQRRRVAVIAQAAGVDAVRDEAVAEREHLHDRPHAD